MTASCSGLAIRRYLGPNRRKPGAREVEPCRAAPNRGGMSCARVAGSKGHVFEVPRHFGSGEAISVKRLVILFVALCTAAAPSSPSRLAGRWDSQARSRGGLGYWLSLDANGSCTKTTGAMIDGRWTLVGTHLTRTVLIEDGHTDVSELTTTIGRRSMTQTIGGEKRELMRAGALNHGTAGLEGTWTYAHPAGGIAYEEYTADHRFLFRLPMVTEPCSWSATETTLEIVLNSTTTDYAWRIAHEVLTLTHEGAEWTMTRVRGSAPLAERK